MEKLFLSLCLELDSLLVEILEAIEQYVALKVDMEKRMQAGFVNIAKTRYIRGSNSVSTMQLPTSDTTCDIQPLATVHRQREKVEIRNSLLHKDGQQKGAVFNPIKLFGVLVPQALREAQSSFVSSVDKVGDIVFLQKTLDEKLNRYSKLITYKRQLTKKVSNVAP